MPEVPFPDHMTKWHLAIWISNNATTASEKSLLTLNLNQVFVLQIPIIISFIIFILYYLAL